MVLSQLTRMKILISLRKSKLIALHSLASSDFARRTHGATAQRG